MTTPAQPLAADEQNPDIAEAIAEIDAALDGYEAAKEYDEVDVWATYTDTRAGETLRQADIEFDPNFTSVVIDAVANRLEILSVTAQPRTGSGSGDEATAVLNDQWDLNQLGNYLPVWHRRALRDGDGYLLAWPTEHDDTAGIEGEAADGDDDMVETADTVRPTSVNVTYVDPRMARMFYDPENPRVKRCFAQRWIEGRDDTSRVRLNLLYPARVEKYINAEGTAGNKPGDFIPYVDPAALEAYEAALVEQDGPVTEPWPMPNPYGEIPAFHLRTDLDYGRPEARNAFALQDALSRLIEMLMVTVRFQGYPQAYALQEADSLKSQSIMEDPLADTAPGDGWGDDDFGGGPLDPDRLDDRGTGSKLVFSPGAIAMLKGFRAIGQFTPADPNVFLEPWREFGKAIASTTDTPLHRFQGFGQPPSGESLKITEAPLNKKVVDRARLFGTTERELFEFILRVLGHPDQRVTITWANPAALDVAEVWDLVRLKVDLGIPAKVALMQAGVPEPQAEEWAPAVEAAAASRRQVGAAAAAATSNPADTGSAA